ncbi:hypothetical protein GOODEAATRI_000785, partial [Goodea atripinnis]
GSTVSTGRKVRVESGYFSLEKTKSEPSPQSIHHTQPPQHLPLSSSASSSSLGAPSSRYSSESQSQISPHQPSQDPLPSPKALISPSYSTISSSQSSLDSEPSSRASPTWEGRSSNGGGGSTRSISSSGSRVGRPGREYTALSDVPRARILSYKEAFRSEKNRQELRARTRSPGREEVVRLFGEERRASEQSFSELMPNQPLHPCPQAEVSLDTGKDCSVPHVSSSNFLNLRRAKSLDRRATESSMTPSPALPVSLDPSSCAACLPNPVFVYRPSDTTDGVTSDVQEEIEQRWHQVETTPLREEKQGELESQKCKQDLAQQQIRTLKRSYTEAQDAVGRHETDIQALQSKLASAMAEILASEQAVARMRNELKLEQQRSKEQEEEYGHNEATLRAQLKDSEDRLREVEASLLERNQALRHLERQQALQRDHMKEIQRLQERLQEVTARLTATEEGQALKEERLRNEHCSMQEKHERERQNLCRRLAEAETTQKEVKDRLLEAEQQVEALLRGRRASGGKECKEEMLKMQEQLVQKTDMVETLRESVRRLEEEKGQLTCRCQELLNQITEADREVNKLRNRLETEEADYYTLEHSYERATQEFQKMSQFLREKEDEIKHTKEMYERLMERKEEDLKEALIKMTALGTSLEETEQKLQAKEVLICQMSQSLISKTEPCRAEDLQAKLVVAEDRIEELEQHLTTLQLGYSDLYLEGKPISDQDRKGIVKSSSPLSSNTELSIDDSKTDKNLSDDQESEAKRPRIRFPSIQRQKYVDPEGANGSHESSLFVEREQTSNQDVNVDDQSVDANISDIALSHISDPEKFIAIIHTLETKLLATEEKLRNLTQNLDVQRAAETTEICQMSENMPRSPAEVASVGSVIRSSSALKHYTDALVCVENGREKVRAVLSGSHGTSDLHLHSLSEIESDLFSASLHIRQGQKKLEEQSPAVHQAQTPETVDNEALLLFAKTLSFEAAVLSKMALLIQTSKSDLLQALVEIWEDLEHVITSEKDCLAIVYADVLTRKLMLESAFWKELEKSEADAAGLKESEAAGVDKSVVFNTFLKAEIAYSMENLKLCYEEKFKVLKGELDDAHNRLYQREMALKAIIDASKRPDLKSVIKDVKKDLGIGKQKLADIRPPELAPYMEQIKMEEARDLAEQIVDRHLESVMPSCGHQSIELFKNTHDNLAKELQRQAGILQKYAEEIESSGSHPALSKMIQAVLGRQTSHNVTSTSLCLREALIQAQVAYVACRLRVMHEQELGLCKQTSQNMEALVQQHACRVAHIQEKYEVSLQEERENFSQTMTTLQKENETLKSELSKRVNQLTQQQEQVALLEDRFRKEAEELKEKCQNELSQAEHCRASTELALIETAADSQRKLEVLLADIDNMEERHHSHVRKLEEQFEDRIMELQHIHKEELDKLHSQYVESIQSAKKHLEVLQSPPCEEAEMQMEEEEQGKRLNAQNMSEVDSMMVLKDRIQELETQMNSMKDELENKHLEGDVASLREKYQRDFESLKVFLLLLHPKDLMFIIITPRSGVQMRIAKNDNLPYREELQSIHRELEVLSEQYSQKCLENAHLAQALEAERQALRQCQRENQELNAHNQVSILLMFNSNRLFCQDKKYATDKYKDIYTELSIVKAKADCDISKLKEKLLMATEALGERSVEDAVTSGYGLYKCSSPSDLKILL